MRFVILACVVLSTPVATAQPGGVADSLFLWFRADHVLSEQCRNPVGLGEGVGCWSDQSGNEHHASIGFATPVATTSNRLGGRPVVRFDGTGYYEVPTLVPTTENPEENFRSPVTVFVVYDKPEESGGYWQRVVASVGGGCADYLTESVLFTLSNTDANADNRLDALDAPVLAATNYGGASRYYSRFRLGDVARTLWSCVAPAAFHGDIAEVILYNRALPPAERGAVYNALALRYRIGRSTESKPTVLANQRPGGPLGETAAAVSFYESPSSTDGQLEVTTTSGASAPLPDGLVHLYMERVWTFTPTDLDGVIAEVSFDLEALGVDLPADFSDVRVLTRATDADPWRDVSGDDGVRVFYQRPIVTATGLAPSGQFALASTSVPVAVETDPVSALALTVTPNPAQGPIELTFELAEAGSVELAVYDLLGRRMASVLEGTVYLPGVHEVTLDASAWAPGVYLIRLVASGEPATQRLTVVR